MAILLMRQTILEQSTLRRSGRSCLAVRLTKSVPCSVAGRFQQHFARDPSPSVSQCCANRQFLLAPIGAHQHQIRDIGARDQQFYTHCAH
jgi:hypothetical protein